MNLRELYQEPIEKILKNGGALAYILLILFIYNWIRNPCFFDDLIRLQAFMIVTIMLALMNVVVILLVIPLKLRFNFRRIPILNHHSYIILLILFFFLNSIVFISIFTPYAVQEHLGWVRYWNVYEQAKIMVYGGAFFVDILLLGLYIAITGLILEEETR